jgi:hypothetical protein
MRLVEDTQDQGTPMRLMTGTVVMMNCRRLGDMWKQKGNSFGDKSWHGCSVAKQVEL